MTMVMVSTTPISPGTMLYCVMASGLYCAWMRRSTGPSVAARNASGPFRSCCKAVFDQRAQRSRSRCWSRRGRSRRPRRAATGRSPRSKSRLKFSGIVMTNWTSPRASTSCASASLLHLRGRSRSTPLFRIACSSVRPCGPLSASEHGGGQVLRIGVDGEPEQDELHASGCRSSCRTSGGPAASGRIP